MTSILANFTHKLALQWKKVTCILTLALVLSGCGSTSASKPDNYAEIDSILSAMPAYVAIKKQDPAAYERIASTMSGLKPDRSNYNQLLAETSEELYAFIEPRLAHASDEALTEYMELQVDKMEVLKAKGDGLCYQFLVQDPNGPVVSHRNFSRDLVKRDMETLKEVIETSETKRPIADFENVLPSIEIIFFTLEQKYGDDVEMLDNLELASQKKEVYCDMLIDMYDELFALPSQDSIDTLRWLMSEEE
ncbi:hypothetical protein GCE9029_01320 [Grimontia celer]|uniref:Uncharacterized protein n=1 Tax=Grimontia celer TaxID=1796497 RepID=A0A128EXG4_9GAMM|nr:hypothetical protein [Grimontia celer]CZF79207.1 hypothetical protein GCE9029_01320 [Grimontia celer]